MKPADHKELEFMMEHNRLRMVASHAMFELSVFENEPEVAQRWYDRHSKDKATNIALLILYNTPIE